MYSFTFPEIPLVHPFFLDSFSHRTVYYSPLLKTALTIGKLFRHCLNRNEYSGYRGNVFISITEGAFLMYIPIGEFIKQARRKQGLTQTELGADQFSKSYISAVERGQIMPSYQAIRYFAERLQHPFEELKQLLQKTQKMTSSLHTASIEPDEEAVDDQDTLTLLDLAVPGKDPGTYALLPEALELSLDPNLRSALKKHVRAAFAKGQLAQEKGDFATAQTELEYALALAPDEYAAAILDTLGTGAYTQQAYERALEYYLRAHQHVYAQQNSSVDLLFHVELHCGHAYRALANHQAAQQHYETARKLLRPSQNMRVVWQLYMGLGYCTYAALYQVSMTSSTTLISTLAPEEVEYRFQQALSFLLQSRTLSQMSGDVEGEISIRLTYAMMLLDLCSWRQQQALRKVQNHTTQHLEPVQINCASLLDELDEQCYQALLCLVEKYQSSTQTIPTSLEHMAATALAYLIRSLGRRATIAQLGGYIDTATRERSLACMLCQQVLDALRKTSLTWDLILDALKIARHRVPFEQPFIPHLPDLSSLDSTQLQTRALWLTEIYFATGELDEDYASTLTDPLLVNNTYTMADECFCLATNWISRASQSRVDDTFDIGYAVRMYQRCSDILAQRLERASFTKETSNTIMRLLQIALLFLPQNSSAVTVELQK